jgi:hypothetical protein
MAFRRLKSLATALERYEGAPAMGPPLSAAHDDRDLVLGEADNLIMWRARHGAISWSSPRVRILAAVIGPASDLALARIR